MKLRNRMYIGLAAVATTFAVTAFLVADTQRAYLTDQVDDQLKSASPFALNVLSAVPPGEERPLVGERPSSDPVGLSELFVGHLDADGTLTPTLVSQLADGQPVVTVAQAQAALRHAEPLTLERQGGSGRYRALVVPSPDRDGWDIIALPLDRADSAYSRLLLATGIGGLAVLGMIALSTVWVMRLGVKPINDMADAADAIRSGDRDRRIARYPAGTEAGRLSLTLNSMLDERQEADDRLRQFVADASHELRTPLTSIRGYSDLYQHGGLDDRAALDDAMRRVASEAGRMGALVDDLLLLSTLDQHREIREDRVDLALVLGDVAHDAKAVQPDRVVSVNSETQLVVTGDSERLHQVVAVLVHNAMMHTPLDTNVELCGRADVGSVAIEVVDHGPGMDAASAENAFERFFRGDPSRSRHSGGSGLGLSIAKSIVDAHHGTISLTTSPGEGCRFRIVLPAASPSPTLSPASAS
jgi:two-component system, OmpR family, sensor kinase